MKRPDGKEIDEATTFCVIGPDGTGKSLLALHMASDYWWRTGFATKRPKVIYVSTDLSVERAISVWERFWLHRPELRRKLVPFEDHWRRMGHEPDGGLIREYEDENGSKVDLWPYEPVNESDAFARMVAADDPDQTNRVAFLDLEATTTGDDWGFVHTLLASLPPPAAGEPRHLLVVDAVEGLEVLVGERDAFGERQSRRGRIAQLIRAASKKCHLMFVVEEPTDGERVPEVFVSDVVLRCRAMTDRDYRRRTIEVEKVRGQAHVRGEHEFRVRQECSKTGDQPNPDDPEVGLVLNQKEGGEWIRKHMAYIQVFPSFHQLSNTDAKLGRQPPFPSDPRVWRHASFGIYQADAMLASAIRPVKGEKSGTERNLAGFDEMGLPSGSVTALIGNESTYKTRLARAFLAQCFRTRHEVREGTPHEAIQEANRNDWLSGQGAAILLSTYPISQEDLRDKLTHHLIRPPATAPPTAGRPTQDRGLKERLIVRQLPSHYLPSAVLAHIVREVVAEAERLLTQPYLDNKVTPPDTLKSRIRLVIDDWTSILATYPEIARDPLALPYMVTFLRQKGVTTLILGTRSGNPNDRGNESFDREDHGLRLLADHHLFTWHVPFYGERRVAMTALPSLNADDIQLVRELRPGRRGELPANRLCDTSVHGRKQPPLDTDRQRADAAAEIDPEALVVDPHFEMYRDLDEERPTPVTLQVQLYAEKEDTPAAKLHIQGVQELLRQVFGRNTGQAVVLSHYGDTYERLRELSYLQSEAKLDHTLVLQVDEFWAESRSELRRQERYLRARTVDRHGQSIRFEDPFQLFGMTAATRANERVPGDDSWRGPLCRYQFFNTLGYRYDDLEKGFPIYKVPFTWDFGFLLCNRTVWEQAFPIADHRTARWEKPNPSAPWELNRRTVRETWDRLWKVSLPTDEPAHAVAHWLGHNTGPTGTPGKPKSEREQPAGNMVPSEGRPRDRHDKDTGHQQQHELVSWREFFGACVSVAKHTRYEFVPFDLDLLTAESFACLVSEVWMSEVYQAATAKPTPPLPKKGAKKGAADAMSNEARLKADLIPPADKKDGGRTPPPNVGNEWVPRTRRDQPSGHSLRDLLGKTKPRDDGGDEKPELCDESNMYRRALYRTLLLLDEVFPPSQLPDQGLILTPRTASAKAVASRQWYSTAANTLHAAADKRALLVAGLPGHFSVRGDWFLAIARGSRSPRLGERVIDLMCSRRGNIHRLQSGTGLPVRMLKCPADTLPTRQERVEYRTALTYTHHDGREEPIHYHELRKLGAFDEIDHLGRGQNFFWYWRSTIRSYDYQAHVWQKWLTAVMKEWRLWQRPRVPRTVERIDAANFNVIPEQQWWDGFIEYDYYRFRDLTAADDALCFVEALQNDRWEKFDKYCDALVEALDRASDMHTANS